jgi:uncharacterized membrane protein
LNYLRFFLFGGVVLALTGVLRIVVRPRRPEEVGLQRFVNRGTIWAAFSIAVGVLAILIGLGVVPIVQLGL